MTALLIRSVKITGRKPQESQNPLKMTALLVKSIAITGRNA